MIFKKNTIKSKDNEIILELINFRVNIISILNNAFTSGDNNI